MPVAVRRIGFAYGSNAQQRRHIVDRQHPECRKRKERRATRVGGPWFLQLMHGTIERVSQDL